MSVAWFGGHQAGGPLCDSEGFGGEDREVGYGDLAGMMKKVRVVATVDYYLVR